MRRFLIHEPKDLKGLNMRRFLIHEPKDLVCLFGYLKGGAKISMQSLEDIDGNVHFVVFIEGGTNANV